MEKNKQLVSVGLPVYNGEKYLAGAIESLLSQDYTNIEIILCDNASTDNTSQICGLFLAKVYASSLCPKKNEYWCR